MPKSAMPKTAISQFAPTLIRWHSKHGRHHLPWQNGHDAYRIWVSEIMLQQTQVTTVIAYYLRFMERFTSVNTLAAAPVDEVLSLWSGLGYYARARNLHRTAQHIVAEYSGQFPSDPAILQTLPGIGRSTAAAICAFAFNGRHAILDGNVKRVLCRYFAIRGVPGTSIVEQALWALAEQMLPATADMPVYTQAQMDLGANICRRQPDCSFCPLTKNCRALAEGLVAELPERPAKKTRPQRHSDFLVLLNGEQVYLEQRPPTGIWGGLWSLPEFTANTTDSAVQAASLVLQTAPNNFQPAGTLAARQHVFSHFELHMQPHLLAVSPHHASRATEHGGRWLSLQALDTLGLAAPVRKILDEVATLRANSHQYR